MSTSSTVRSPLHVDPKTATLRADIQLAINSLDDRLREQLLYISKHTYAEGADTFGISRETLFANVREAKRRVAQDLLGGDERLNPESVELVAMAVDVAAMRMARMANQQESIWRRAVSQLVEVGNVRAFTLEPLRLTGAVGVVLMMVAVAALAGDGMEKLNEDQKRVVGEKAANQQKEQGEVAKRKKEGETYVRLETESGGVLTNEDIARIIPEFVQSDGNSHRVTIPGGKIFNERVKISGEILKECEESEADSTADACEWTQRQVVKNTRILVRYFYATKCQDWLWSPVGLYAHTLERYLNDDEEPNGGHDGEELGGCPTLKALLGSQSLFHYSRSTTR